MKDSALAGAKEAGSEVTVVNLNKINVCSCKSWGNGWGECLSKHECQVIDGFQALHKDMSDIDAFIFITPVYWGEMSESMKAFTDRIRRCEAWKKENSLFYNKPVICVAAAGGSGNGTLSCLASMERLVMHVGADKFDFVSITRKTREFKLETIKTSAKKLVQVYAK